MFLQILLFILIELAFVAVLAIGVMLLGSAKKAAFAVMKRNFASYFSTPTGYVFLCLFVILSSGFAFCSHNFFTANLANLDQLNEWLPYIMLIFIPAITMSIWSEERRQGTDELLLTLPADDFDIVIGKYLSAAAIFTVSLVFSQTWNFSVLCSLSLGDLDMGLFVTTSFGYWLMGMAMIALGMVASFLTSNLTVGFILGVVVNAPLVLAALADVLPWNQMARGVSRWSIGSQFDDFGRGVISLSSTIYFLMLVVIGLYLCMVLIGRRHWLGGKDGESLLWHFLVRVVALVLVLFGTNYFFSNRDFIRIDATRGQISSLSPDTKSLIKGLEAEHDIHIDAFISKEVPELYMKTKLDLVSMLKEFQAMSGGDTNVVVRIHDNLEPSDDVAALAEDRYGIAAQPVRTRTRGAIKDEEIILGAAFTSGLEKVVVPFFDYGVSVEYELVRSIATVAESKRKKVGVLSTDAQLMGGFSFAGGMPQQVPKQAIIEELEKQYEVEEVDASSPIKEGFYDVLLAVQPSSLSPEAFDNFVNAVRRGQPTAIFEDPRPVFMAQAPGTGDPKRAPGGGMMGMGGQNQPKGDIQKLWDLLDIKVPGKAGFDGNFQPDLAWQQYLPYQKLQIEGIPDQWVFCSNNAPEGEDSINWESRITHGLNEVFFPVPGVINPSPDAKLKFTKLITTGAQAGTISSQDFQQTQSSPMLLKAKQGRTAGRQTIAARIYGEPAAEPSMADEADSAGDGATAADGEADKSKKEKKPIDVVYVADIDLMISTFLRIRARPEDDPEINWQFENVNFLLNVIDVLADQDKFVGIRNRKPYHATLRLVEERTSAAREVEFEERLKYQAEFDAEIKKIEDSNEEAVEKFQKKVDDLRKRQAEGSDFDIAELQAAAQALAVKQQHLQQQLEKTRKSLESKLNRNVRKIRRETDNAIGKIQLRYKAMAVGIPWLPPFIVGLVVFMLRALREREGISKQRLRNS